MNYDELAFVNQQLAGMLKSGIPLEGALRQLCATMKHGTLREELTALEADLAKGIPLTEALAARKLPEFYRRMLQVGLKGNDLPGVLLLVADYYAKVNAVWTRLKGLMIYPVLVLLTATALSTVLALVLQTMMADAIWPAFGVGQGNGSSVAAFVWFPVMLLGTASVTVLLFISVPSVRRTMRWRLPGFQEASLCQFASSMSLMLKGGGNLNEALGLLEQMEQGTMAGTEIARWRERLSQGYRKMGDVMGVGRAFPPLFVWLIDSVGEDLGAGFSRAAEIYRARALYRIDLLLYVALPMSIVTLGAMIICQVVPVIRAFVHMGDAMM